MRARRLNPSFDSLDSRLVLDSGAAVVTGGAVASTVVGTVLPTVSLADPDPTGIVDWYQDGTPPTDPYNPYDAPLEWALLPTS